MSEITNASGAGSAAGKRDKLILVDGHSTLFRAFYGMPDLTNSKGVHTGAVYGFLNILFKILDEEDAQYLVVAFDVHAPTFRHKAYKEYKGTRKPMPPELREQVPLIKDVLHAMQIATCEREGLEADDILGSLAKQAEADGLNVTLVSGDRDLLQIASDNILVRIPKAKGGQTVIEDYYAKDVVEKLGVTPSEFIQVKALMGDTADNIPGVPKVGPKTATGLIQQYHSVDGVYEHLDEIKRASLKKTLTENEDKARMSLFLATIKTDCNTGIDRDQAKIGNLYTPEAFELFTELNFKNFLSRFDDRSVKTPKKNLSIIRVTDEEQAARALSALEDKINGGKNEDDTVGVYTVFEPALYGSQEKWKLYGIAAAVDGACYYFDGCRGLRPETMENLLASLRKTALRRTAEKGEGTDKDEIPEAAPLAVFDLKEQFPLWGIEAGNEFQDGIHLDGIADLLIESYLVNPLKNDYEIQDVVSEYLGETIAPLKQILGKKKLNEIMEGGVGKEDEGLQSGETPNRKTRKRENPESLRSPETQENKIQSDKIQKDKEKEDKIQEIDVFACRCADGLRRAAPKVRSRLIKEGMWKLYTRMERPLSYILYDMERIGIRIHPEALKQFSDLLGERIVELEDSIHEQTGEDFNIASPKQLGEVLFVKMGLPGGKKTKTGYSTAASVLEKLAPDYPVVNDILEYRALTKLKSTYADGLTAFIAPDSRIHTTFHQTITATGRISSTDPNLQNIPMRTELGRQIRKAFVPKDGFIFTDSDYSQIELRILAHMSGDQGLIEAYRENKDIHRSTAAKVFHTPFEEVTPLQRRNAKAVNFGIVYGISSFGLSQGLSISRKEAAEYIKAYFETYPGIRTFLDNLVSSAKEKGYAVTMYGRRRPVPELKSSNFMQRQFGERVAMNSPIQGSAADIMKLAMIDVWEELHRRQMKSELILQIHDELLIETAPGEEEQVKEILAEKMSGAADLSVVLETDIHSGTDWYMAK